METWIKHIVQKIYPKNNYQIFVWPNSTNSIVEILTNGTATIYIGTKNKNKNVLIGEIAHEISEIILGSEKLHKKRYYKIIFKITKSYKLTNKTSYFLALISGLIFKNETKADQLALKILKNSNFNQNYVYDYLVWLKKQKNGFIIKWVIKKRLKKIINLLKIN